MSHYWCSVRVNHIHTDENMTNPLTKGLTREKIFKTLEKMGLMPIE